MCMTVFVNRQCGGEYHTPVRHPEPLPVDMFHHHIAICYVYGEAAWVDAIKVYAWRDAEDRGPGQRG